MDTFPPCFKSDEPLSQLNYPLKLVKKQTLSYLTTCSPSCPSSKRAGFFCRKSYAMFEMNEKSILRFLFFELWLILLPIFKCFYLNNRPRMYKKLSQRCVKPDNQLASHPRTGRFRLHQIRDLMQGFPANQLTNYHNMVKKNTMCR